MMLTLRCRAHFLYGHEVIACHLDAIVNKGAPAKVRFGLESGSKDAECDHFLISALHKDGPRDEKHHEQQQDLQQDSIRDVHNSVSRWVVL
jgi:hypothetical protein